MHTLMFTMLLYCKVLYSCIVYLSHSRTHVYKLSWPFASFVEVELQLDMLVMPDLKACISACCKYGHGRHITSCAYQTWAHTHTLRWYKR